MQPISNCEVSEEQACRIGFMSGEISVPDDFDYMEADSIAAQFEGESVESYFP